MDTYYAKALMNRRTFLCGAGKFLGAAALVAKAPFIFDMGRGIWRREPQILGLGNTVTHEDGTKWIYILGITNAGSFVSIDKNYNATTVPNGTLAQREPITIGFSPTSMNFDYGWVQIQGPVNNSHLDPNLLIPG